MRAHLSRVCLCIATLALAACGGDTTAPAPQQTQPPIITPPPPDTTTVSSGFVGTVELPRVYLNTTAPTAPAAGRVVIPVAAGGNLQTAINNAQPGDVIELAAGATFTGNFTLPNKGTTSTNWIVIRPSNWASLPAAGARMTPSLAAQLTLPKILTPNTNNAILMATGAHHYRLVGLEVGVTPTNVMSYAAIALDAQQKTLADVPHDIVVDRMYVHGTATGTLRRCIQLNSASTAIIDSWLSDCHEKGSDSQAIAGWNGPGPFKIVNISLEGAGETLLVGGGDPSIRDLVPADIEIRRNHFTKPLTWKGVWTVKNLLEIKHAQRVLIEGNIFENSWTDGQNGTGLVIKTVNQNGKCTWCVTQDVNVRLNIVRNVGAGFNIAGAPDNVVPCPCIPARRVSVMDNIIANINTAPYIGDGRGFATYGTVTEVLIAHNTMMAPTNSAFVLGPAGTTQLNFTAKDNLVGGGAYGLLGDNVGGASALARYAPGGVFAGNVMILATASTMPAGNFYPTSATAVGFADAANEDFHLLPSSPYKGKATDGKDPGANVDGVNAAVANVRVAP
jgi:hypothetical protein